MLLNLSGLVVSSDLLLHSKLLPSLPSLGLAVAFAATTNDHSIV